MSFQRPYAIHRPVHYLQLFRIIFKHITKQNKQKKNKPDDIRDGRWHTELRRTSMISSQYVIDSSEYPFTKCGMQQVTTRQSIKFDFVKNILCEKNRTNNHFFLSYLITNLLDYKNFLLIYCLLLKSWLLTELTRW